MARWTALLPLLLLGCGARQPAAQPDGMERGDAATQVDAAHDTAPPPPDGPRPRPDGALSAFCSGTKPRAEIDGRTLAVSGVLSGRWLMASCCPPGEFVTVDAVDPIGAKVKLTVEILRMIGTSAPTSITLDLSKPPKGWLVDVRCEPYKACGRLRPDNATFGGSLEMTAMLGAPAYRVSVCLEASPKPPQPPPPRALEPVRLYLHKVLVNTACVVGMDHTCNANPSISALRGKCNSDSTCTCLLGAKKTPDGKCL